MKLIKLTAAALALSLAAAAQITAAEPALLVPLERKGGLDTIRIAPSGELRRKSPSAERLGMEKEGASGASVMGKKDPLVILTDPKAGLLTRSFQQISGRIGGGITKAFLRINDDTRIVPVADGRFTASAALKPGLNTITTLAWDLEGNLGKTSLQVFMKPREGGPAVTITEPEDGSTLDITRNRVVRLRAETDDASISKGVLVVNNIPRRVSLIGGILEQELALMPGLNEICVEVVDSSGRAGASSPVRVHTYDAMPKDLVAVLSWDSPVTDLDLHVWDSFGHHTFGDARDPYQCDAAIPKGMLDMDRRGGYGPEVFSLEAAEPEVYTFYVSYNPGIGPDDGADAYLRLLLYGDEPTRRIMRVFGPAHLDSGRPAWEAAHVKMPEGVFFQEKDADLRKTLGMDSKAVKRLTLMLREENRAFALLAISAMGRIKSEEAVVPLVEVLSGGPVEQRRAAAGALWNIRSVESVPGLTEALMDEDPEVRRAAAGALGSIGEKRSAYSLSVLLAEEGDPLVRIEAIRSLGLIGDARGINTLAALSKNADPRVRIGAMMALGGIRDEATTGILLEALKDEVSGVREAAARAAGRQGTAEAIQPLMDLLYFDDDEGVRVQSAIALGEIGSEEAMGELEKAVRSDFSDRVRFCAGKAIEKITPPPETLKREAVQPYLPLEEEEDLVIY